MLLSVVFFMKFTSGESRFSVTTVQMGGGGYPDATLHFHTALHSPRSFTAALAAEGTYTLSGCDVFPV